MIKINWIERNTEQAIVEQNHTFLGLLMSCAPNERIPVHHDRQQLRLPLPPGIVHRQSNAYTIQHKHVDWCGVDSRSTAAAAYKKNRHHIRRQVGFAVDSSRRKRPLLCRCPHRDRDAYPSDDHVYDGCSRHFHIPSIEGRRVTDSVHLR